MTLSKFIEGLTILQRYYDKDGYHVGAEHDEFYAYATDRLLSAADAARMRELGWKSSEDGWSAML